MKCLSLPIQIATLALISGLFYDSPACAASAAGQRPGYHYAENPDIAESLDKLARLFDEDLIEWMASLYDPKTGGFYYSISARETDGFEPDIESTAQAVGFLKKRDMVGKMPAAMKAQLIAFFRERQDPDTGYLYDPQFGADVSQAKKERNLSQATARLRWLGSSPPHPLPTERAAGKKSPSGRASPLPAH